MYNFSLGYTNSAITISLNGGVFDNETVIDVAGLSNSVGSFGVYNYYQEAVTYNGFEEDTCQVDCGQSVAEPTSIMMLGLSLIGIAVSRRRKLF
ncbi:MAG: PEP-CTERM sorting domain-containing protein [Psychromonas sp.]|nr:PEP-CTERM sorting domain-containing protein [Alteromonadales bacterium]MCP5079615.1 PEP-CTERM sorting domain-containing protein [Psychromonas sp.]